MSKTHEKTETTDRTGLGRRHGRFQTPKANAHMEPHNRDAITADDANVHTQVRALRPAVAKLP